MVCLIYLTCVKIALAYVRAREIKLLKLLKYIPKCPQEKLTSIILTLSFAKYELKSCILIVADISTNFKLGF